MKRHSRHCVGLWSEFTHAKGDCKWLSPMGCAPHALKPEGFHRRPAEDCAGTASMTSSLQATASEKKSGVFWKFQKSQMKKEPQPAGGTLVTKAIVWQVTWRKKLLYILSHKSKTLWQLRANWFIFDNHFLLHHWNIISILCISIVNAAVLTTAFKNNVFKIAEYIYSSTALVQFWVENIDHKTFQREELYLLLHYIYLMTWVTSYLTDLIYSKNIINK